MSNDAADDFAKIAADFLESYVPAPWGKMTSVIVSRYGKYPIQYLLPSDAQNQSAHKYAHQPNFAVIGMGRCGSHVGVALHQMVFKEQSNTQQIGHDHRNTATVLRQWYKKLFTSTSGRRALSFKPVMLVGDTDVTTFADVAGLTSSQPTDIAQLDGAETPVLTLSYAPLASAGVGHNPIISQYFTRALLISPESDSSGQAFGWGQAKQFLLSIQAAEPAKTEDGADERVPPRLAFYVFSAGGGTGCGAASEILRAQQFASVTATDSSFTYYCAVAVLPQAADQERRRMLNMGRFVVQYLADQAILLRDKHDYTEVPQFRGSSIIAPLASKKDDTVSSATMRPPVAVSSWNSVLLVSNQIMNPSNDSLERAIELSNQYIAQQLFNLAGPQISASNLTLIDPHALPRKNFEAVRLDAMDLLSSLRGPCACCFSVASTREARKESGQQKESGQEFEWIREMFLRAISLPQLREATQLLEGVSLSPCAPEDYRSLLSQGSIEEKMQKCSELPFFKQCGSIVFTLTAPQDGTITQADLDELMDLCGLLFPNLKETRYSAIYGTTDQYTLSIYVEGSAIFAPEVVRGVRNYLYLCWPLARRMEADQFEKWWNGILSQEPPLTVESVREALGPAEELKSEYPGLKAAQQVAVRSWQSLLDRTVADDEARKLVADRLSFEELSVTSVEVTSALSFYNYYHNRGWLPTLD